MATPPDFVAGQVLTAAQLNQIGLWTEIPSSVTVTGGGSSGSVATNGEVTFTTAATVSVNGCFNADFINYRIVCALDSSAASVDGFIRLRVAGTDNSTASSYVYQLTVGNASSITTGRTTSNTWNAWGAANVATNGFVVDVYRPFLADETAFSSLSTNSFASAFMQLVIGTHNQATSYDGFTIYPSSGSITGKLTVYGYNG